MYTFMALVGGFASIWALLGWVACALFAGHVATQKGRCTACWVIWGVLFGPLALLATVGLPKVGPTSKTHARCPACREFVLPQAIKCKHCHTEFDDDNPAHNVPGQTAYSAFKEEDTNHYRAIAITMGVIVGLLILLGIASSL